METQRKPSSPKDFAPATLEVGESLSTFFALNWGFSPDLRREMTCFLGVSLERPLGNLAVSSFKLAASFGHKHACRTTGYVDDYRGNGDEPKMEKLEIG